jgi:hypothetical protein
MRSESRLVKNDQSEPLPLLARARQTRMAAGLLGLDAVNKSIRIRTAPLAVSTSSKCGHWKMYQIPPARAGGNACPTTASQALAVARWGRRFRLPDFFTRSRRDICARRLAETFRLSPYLPGKPNPDGNRRNNHRLHPNIVKRPGQPHFHGEIGVCPRFFPLLLVTMERPTTDSQ